MPAVEHAAELLAKRHSVVHAMLINEALNQAVGDWKLLHYKTHIRNPADAGTLDDLAGQIMKTRSCLVHILTAQVNNRAPSLEQQ